MKKILLAMLAITVSFSVMAQTEHGNKKEKNWKNKEFKNKEFKGKENLDKLNLTEAQKVEMKRINEDFKQKMRDLHNQGNITVNEQKERRLALAKEHREKIRSILTEEQRKEIETFKHARGARGNEAVRENAKELAKDLQLTPEQSARMATINEAFKIKLKDIKQNNSLSREDKKEQVKNLMEQHRSEMKALLTDEQKEKMKNHRRNRPNRSLVK